jgi:hypothetical protein
MWHLSIAFIVIAALLAVASTVLRALGIRYSADRYTAVAPDGIAYDVLDHRDGIPVRTSGESVFAGSWTAGIVGLFRRWRHKPWRWTVRVRLAPYRGYADLLRETFADRARALQRADELCTMIIAGGRLWTIEPV